MLDPTPKLLLALSFHMTMSQKSRQRTNNLVAQINSWFGAENISSRLHIHKALPSLWACTGCILEKYLLS